MKSKLLTLIQEKKICIAIIGLGYVGLPLAVSFAKAGIKVIGFEKSEKKIESIHVGENYIADVDNEEFKSVIASGTLKATADFSKIKEGQAVIICVPTPLDEFKRPEMSYLQDSCN